MRGRVGWAIELLGELGVQLTLVDIGASLEPFEPFQPLLWRATYVAFDPDLRDLHDQSDGSGRRVVINKAVVADAGQDMVSFFLTENPTCSSTLPPQSSALAGYLHAHRFDVVDKTELAATTLSEALQSVGVERVDWLKLDTQGTDGRLLRSLSDELWAGLMAVDAEPGFDPYYEGEDTFGELHRDMTARGFWMADMNLTTGVRMRRATFDDRFRSGSRVARFAYEVTLKRSPMAGGPRYLRTIESLRTVGASREDYLRLWACAAFSGNHPFALDVVAACEEDHGADDVTDKLARQSLRDNKAYVLRNFWRHASKLKRSNIAHAIRWR